MDLSNVTTIEEWPEPKNYTELQWFLGFANFYHRFIAGFTHITHPLHQLTGHASWQWDQEEQVAFTTLQCAVITTLTLAIPANKEKY